MSFLLSPIFEFVGAWEFTEREVTESILILVHSLIVKIGMFSLNRVTRYAAAIFTFCQSLFQLPYSHFTSCDALKPCIKLRSSFAIEMPVKFGQAMVKDQVFWSRLSIERTYISTKSADIFCIASILTVTHMEGIKRWLRMTIDLTLYQRCAATPSHPLRQSLIASWKTSIIKYILYLGSLVNVSSVRLQEWPHSYALKNALPAAFCYLQTNIGGQRYPVLREYYEKDQSIQWSY